MVKYTELELGIKYKLGDINVGKLISRNDNILIFENSEFGERTGNEIDAVEEDDFTEIKRQKSVTPKSRKRGGKGGKKEKGEKGGQRKEQAKSKKNIRAFHTINFTFLSFKMRIRVIL